MNATATASKKPESSTNQGPRNFTPSVWLLRHLEDGPLPKNLGGLLKDPRFVSRNNMRRPNSLALRECYLIDSEALEALLSNRDILPWLALDAKGTVVAEASTREEAESLVAEKKAVRAMPRADHR